MFNYFILYNNRHGFHVLSVLFKWLMNDIWNQEKDSVDDFSLIYMLTLLFLSYSIAFIDYLTDFRRFLNISKDYKEFSGIRWDFKGS